MTKLKLHQTDTSAFLDKKMRAYTVKVMTHVDYQPLNRSQHWPVAESYAAARALSPFPEKVIR